MGAGLRTCNVHFNRPADAAAWSEWLALAGAVNDAKRARGKQRRTLARALAGALRRDADRLRAECSRLGLDAAAIIRTDEEKRKARRTGPYVRKLTDEQRTELARLQLVKAREARAAAREARKALGLADTPGTAEKRARRLGIAGGDELGDAFRPAD